MDYHQRINQIKRKIDALKTNKAIYESKQEELLSSLRDEFGIETFDEIKTLQKELLRQSAILEKRAKSLLRTVEDKLRKYDD